MLVTDFSHIPSTAVTPTSVITGVPSTQGVATPTPQPTPTQDTTCSVLAKLADDAEFFTCTADKTEPCDTVFCSREFVGKQYSAVVVLLPCETPAAVRIVMNEGERVLVNETVDHSKEITIPELFGLVLNVTLDHFDDAIGLQVKVCVCACVCACVCVRTWFIGMGMLPVMCLCTQTKYTQ